jgi:hypothetical protein
MPFINLPPVLSTIMDELDKRIRRLETSYRFNVPIVNGIPTNLNNGDMWINSANGKLYVHYNNTNHQIANL